MIKFYIWNLQESDNFQCLDTKCKFVFVKNNVTVKCCLLLNTNCKIASVKPVFSWISVSPEQQIKSVLLVEFKFDKKPLL